MDQQIAFVLICTTAALVAGLAVAGLIGIYRRRWHSIDHVESYWSGL